tara:strand:+ start:159 stop:515 length:357 start_codon:yes stop_codon:yes gene_type:complete
MWKNLEERRLYELWNEFQMLEDGAKFLEKHNEKLKKTNEILNESLCELEVQHETLKEVNQVKNDNLNASLCVLEEKHERLKEENQKYKTEIGRLKSRITLLEIELENQVENPAECEIL